MGKNFDQTKKYNTVDGIEYLQGVDVGYDITVDDIKLPNVSFRDVKKVKFELIRRGKLPHKINEKRISKKRYES